ncbi:MAG: DUF4180 domain-containing protein [Clostridiales bacterium]|nr:DUF4180 domain-containing protein [Clostridiales bacterium]
MEITTVKGKQYDIAVVNSDEIVITGVQSALDLIMSVSYETGCNRIIINKSAICEDFFDLSTKIAGDILQKFVTYKIKIAIVGDFSAYTSKSLKAFIYESNRGNDVLFLSDYEQAVDKLQRG